MFDFGKIYDKIEGPLFAGDEDGAERVCLSHLPRMLGKFELSSKETQSVSGQIKIAKAVVLQASATAILSCMPWWLVADFIWYGYSPAKAATPDPEALSIRLFS